MGSITGPAAAPAALAPLVALIEATLGQPKHNRCRCVTAVNTRMATAIQILCVIAYKGRGHDRPLIKEPADQPRRAAHPEKHEAARLGPDPPWQGWRRPARRAAGSVPDRSSGS